MQNRMKKTYHIPKTSLPEALKMSMMEMSDAKTHTQALKLWWRALVSSMLRQHLSCSKAHCHTKCKTDHKTHCH